MTTKPAAAAMLSVFDGRECVGFLLRRGRAGIEAFTADEKTLGTFATEREAATACWGAARGQAEAAS